VAHLWRTTFDIGPAWTALLQNLDESVGLARFAGPGAWNDLDMLEARAGAGESDLGLRCRGVALPVLIHTWPAGLHQSS
jgi:hypothetical protein